jgi:hypothetical protein
MPDPASPNPEPLIRQQVPADGVDPNVKLPPSVLAARAASDAAYAAAYPAEGTQQAQVQPQNGQLTLPGVPPAPAAPPNGQVQQELSDTNPDGTINWENRFKALKGRYDSDSKRWGETQQQYDERMRALATENNNLKRPPLPGEQPPPRLVTQQEVTDYGADFIDVVKRAAVEAVLPMMRPIAQEIGTVKARVDNTEAETGKQFVSRMHSTMDANVPGWQQMNEDPNFIAWTRQPDVFSGLNRQEMLQKAWYAGDSNRVTAFFQSFLAEEAATNPAAAQARQQAMLGAGGHAQLPNGGGPASPAQPLAPRVTLESLAAPGRARAAGVTPPAGKPVWTAAGISQFYMDVAQGKFRGREPDRLATEQDLMMAQREGRIIVNPRTATTLTGN